MLSRQTALTRPAQVTVEGEDRSLRIVGEKHNFFQQNYDEINRPT